MRASTSTSVKASPRAMQVKKVAALVEARDLGFRLRVEEFLDVRRLPALIAGADDLGRTRPDFAGGVLVQGADDLARAGRTGARDRPGPTDGE